MVCSAPRFRLELYSVLRHSVYIRGCNGRVTEPSGQVVAGLAGWHLHRFKSKCCSIDSEPLWASLLIS